jgi:hypothetical protein
MMMTCASRDADCDDVSAVDSDDDVAFAAMERLLWSIESTCKKSHIVRRRVPVFDDELHKATFTSESKINCRNRNISTTNRSYVAAFVLFVASARLPAVVVKFCKFENTKSNRSSENLFDL